MTDTGRVGGLPRNRRPSLQPASLNVVLTSNAIFSVLACGAPPLTYQWQHAATNLPAATNAVFTLPDITTNEAGTYVVLVTNRSGSVTSETAILTVLRPPVVARQPRSLAAAPGGMAGFSVSVQGVTPFAYQWQKNGGAMPGQTKASLTVSNLQMEDFASYTVTVTNADGWAVSDPAALTLAVCPTIGPINFNLATFMLSVPTEVGPTYVIEYKDSIEEPIWRVLTTVTGTGSVIPITDNGLTNTSRYYRVRVR